MTSVLDDVPKSYWTKRRRIVKSVNKVMEETSDLDVGHDEGLTITEMVGIDATRPGNNAAADASRSLISLECDSASASSGSELSVDSDMCDHIPDFDDGEHISDTSSLSSDLSDEWDLADQLSNWVLTYNICKDAVTALLHMLHVHLPGLPLDARTLLKTPDSSNYKIKTITGGSYYHFGVASGLKKLYDDGFVANSTASDTRLLELQVNVDGLPIYKSTNYQLWPILGMVVNVRDKVPFVIGLFGGQTKPGSISEYLCAFVDECRGLEETGILLGFDVYGFRIHSILCDAPARAFVRKTKGHTGYYGCDRCVQSGKWLSKMTFPEVAAPKRTHVDFCSKVD